eukprot:526312-Amphidinium_carterae.1
MHNVKTKHQNWILTSSCAQTDALSLVSLLNYMHAGLTKNSSSLPQVPTTGACLRTACCAWCTCSHTAQPILFMRVIIQDPHKHKLSTASTPNLSKLAPTRTRLQVLDSGAANISSTIVLTYFWIQCHVGGVGMW